MTQRATALADRFEQINAELISAVEGCSDAEWQQECHGEGWPIGVTAHHVAQSYPAFKGFIEGLASGANLPPITREMLDNFNAQHATEAANCTREETLMLLRRDGQAAADTVRGLTDKQLDNTAPFGLAGGANVSAEQIAEAMIGHPTDHLASIRASLSR